MDMSCTFGEIRLARFGELEYVGRPKERLQAQIQQLKLELKVERQSKFATSATRGKTWHGEKRVRNEWHCRLSA
jgi:hypothetical protein